MEPVRRGLRLPRVIQDFFSLQLDLDTRRVDTRCRQLNHTTQVSAEKAPSPLSLRNEVEGSRPDQYSSKVPNRPDWH